MVSKPGRQLTFQEHRKKRCDHWNAVARSFGGRKHLGTFYRIKLQDLYRFLVPSGKKVLELGCGEGDLLKAMRPDVGVGVDSSGEMIERARKQHPDLRFLEADVHEMDLGGTFDVIICSDLVNDLWDVQSVFERVASLCHSRTRLIMNVYSRLWQWPLAFARRVGLARPLLEQNWLTVEDLKNLLELSGFEIIRQSCEILCPLRIPLLARLCNRYLVKIWPGRWLALTNVIVACPRREASGSAKDHSVSVVVAARNEEGHIEEIVRRIPELGASTEIVFVEGHSSDNTTKAIEDVIRAFPQHDIKLFHQTGEGKGDAVRLGFEKAAGDILMILDADITVPPEDLCRFYDALVSRKGEFINGVRLVYPMEAEAMRLWNIVGNKFFSLAFSWLLGQSIKDTLCGTKVLWRTDYGEIARNRSYFGDFDPFGDFDLIFGAAKLNLKIVDLPIRYRARVYGATNIQRWRHGLLLFKMVFFAARKIKFV